MKYVNIIYKLKLLFFLDINYSICIRYYYKNKILSLRQFTCRQVDHSDIYTPLYGYSDQVDMYDILCHCDVDFLPKGLYILLDMSTGKSQKYCCTLQAHDSHEAQSYCTHLDL